MMQRTDSLERLMAGEGDSRGWDSWMVSPTHGHEFKQAPGDGCWTGEPDVLQSVGSQRLDMTEWVNLTEDMHMCSVYNIMIIWSLYIDHIDKYVLLFLGIIIHS